MSPADAINQTHLITVVDSNPAKTFATTLNRPANDAADTYIGLDQGPGGVVRNLAQLAFGAPVAISSYIGNSGDNLNFKERLTSSLKTFNVPVKVNGTLQVGPSGSPVTQFVLYSTPSIRPAAVKAATCLDQTFTVPGLTTADRLTALTPPSTLGNVSLTAYVSVANTLLLHFCNPSASSVIPPAGVYSFLATH
jgi:hypothetical protein